MDEFLGGVDCGRIVVALFLAVVAITCWRRLDDQISSGSHRRSRTSIPATYKLAALATALSFTCAATAAADQVGPRTVAIPGTNYDVSLGGAGAEPAALLTRPFLAAIATWLSAEFGLPAFDRHPRIEFVPPQRLAALRYGGLLPPATTQNGRSDQEAEALSRDTLAIYSDSERTIYLSSAWTGKSPADLSVVVHEMVHHIQNLAGLRFECPQEREKVAYAAQERWLALFGGSLAGDFELDGFSLLAKTKCFH